MLTYNQMVVHEPADVTTDRVFHALADATRRDILRRCGTGEPSVSGLAGAYPMSFAAVQKHVAVLERAGLVTKQRRGREQLVRTDASAIARARQTLDELEAAWRGRVRPDDRPARPASTTHSDPRRRPMSVTSLDKDFDTLTMTLVADFDAPVERVWQLWADPRQLERWWGPPTHPATVEEHDLSPGGSGHLLHDQPGGREVPRLLAGSPPSTRRARWRSPTASPTRTATPNPEMPTTTVEMQLTEHDGGTRMELRSAFASKEQMQELIDMGMAEGLQQSVGQMDALLAA